MTIKEFYELVLSGEELTEEALSVAKSLLEKHEREEARKAERKAEKTAENEEIKEKILEIMTESGEPMLASEIGRKMNFSTQKASAMLVQMRAEGRVENGEPVKRTLTYVLKED